MTDDPTALSALLGSFHDKLLAERAAAAAETHVGASPDGLVRVEVTGEPVVTTVTIDAAAAADVAALEARVLAATNDALRRAATASAHRLSALTGATR